MTIADSRKLTRLGMVFFFAGSLVCTANTTDSVPPFTVLDADGARGPVPFSHKVHEGAVNPDSSFVHRAAEGNACAGCHHTVKSTTAAAEYQKCSACHGPDGWSGIPANSGISAEPGNPADKEGVELSNREISHRACIGCHRATQTATPDIFKTTPDGSGKLAWTRCGECHQPSLTAPSVPDIQAFVFPDSGPGSPALTASAITTAVDAAPVNRWDIDPPMRREGRWYDPYHQNPLKGDLPLSGGSRFYTFSAEDEMTGFQRQTTGSWAPGSQGTNLFQRGNQWAVRENLLLTFDLASKSTAFRPAWQIPE